MKWPIPGVWFIGGSGAHGIRGKEWRVEKWQEVSNKEVKELFLPCLSMTSPCFFLLIFFSLVIVCKLLPY